MLPFQPELDVRVLVSYDTCLTHRAPFNYLQRPDLNTKVQLPNYAPSNIITQNTSPPFQMLFVKSTMLLCKSIQFPTPILAAFLLLLLSYYLISVTLNIPSKRRIILENPIQARQKSLHSHADQNRENENPILKATMKTWSSRP